MTAPPPPTPATHTSILLSFFSLLLKQPLGVMMGWFCVWRGLEEEVEMLREVTSQDRRGRQPFPAGIVQVACWPRTV